MQDYPRGQYKESIFWIKRSLYGLGRQTRSDYFGILKTTSHFNEAYILHLGHIMVQQNNVGRQFPDNQYPKVIRLAVGIKDGWCFEIDYHRSQLMLRSANNITVSTILVLMCLICASCRGMKDVVQPIETAPIVISGTNVVIQVTTVQPLDGITQTGMISSPLNETVEQSQSQFVSPVTVDTFLHYEGINVYGNSPLFRVRYADNEWFLEDSHDGPDYPQLTHRTILECHLLLKAGPREDFYVGKTTLSHREWQIGRPHESYLRYSTTADGHYYIFNIKLPAEPANNDRQLCQERVEAVLDTFTILQE